MSNQTEALKMAIEFIEMHLTTNDSAFIERTATLEACKEALEQPAQEPVACDKLTNDEKASIKRQINNAFNEGFEKGKAMSLVASIPPNFIRLESIDTPAPQPAQEPVAWLFIDDGNKYLNFYRCLDEGKNIPLYARESIDD